jgi:hypothetical protein
MKIMDEYFIKLQKLAKTCKYVNLEGEIIKDRKVIGLKSNTIRRKILAEEELTLHKAIDIVKSEKLHLKQSLVLNDMTLHHRKWKSIES